MKISSSMYLVTSGMVLGLFASGWIAHSNLSLENSAVTLLQPEGKLRAEKIYYPKRINDQFRIVISGSGIFSKEITVVQGSNPTGFPNDDGVMLWWENKTSLVVAWPEGSQVNYGRSTVGEIKIKYKNYAPNPSASYHHKINYSTAKDVTEKFDSSQSSNEKNCTIIVSGVDESDDRIFVKIVAHGIGTHSPLPRVFGAVSVKFSIFSDRDPYLSPTSAVINNLFPTEFLRSAPQQTQTSLLYRLFDKDRATSILEAVKLGNFHVDYTVNKNTKMQSVTFKYLAQPGLMDKFNACVESTNVYGVPFFVP